MTMSPYDHDNEKLNTWEESVKVVDQKVELLQTTLELGLQALKLPVDPKQADEATALLQERTQTLNALIRLNSTSHSQESETSSWDVTVKPETDTSVRELVAKVIEQNQQIERVLTRLRQWFADRLQEGTSAEKFARVYSGEEYMNQLPRGLKVDKSL